MAKTSEADPQRAELKAARDKKSKAPKGKDRNALVGRVKKVVKKSRRKLSEEKFERELQRTISFLEQLRARITEPQDGQPAELPTVVTPIATAKHAGKKNKKKKDAAQTVVATAAQIEAPPPGD